MRHARTKKKAPSKIDQIRALLPKGWQVQPTPRETGRRYRFFHGAPATQTYFGPASGQYTALGFKEAHVYAAGLMR